MTEPQESPKGPEHRIVARSRGGVICAAIWRSEGEGGPYYTIGIERRYKSDNTWKSTQVLGVDDLSRVQLVCQRAFEYVALLEDARPQEPAP
jgi:hypothetical protein